MIRLSHSVNRPLPSLRCWQLHTAFSAFSFPVEASRALLLCSSLFLAVILLSACGGNGTPPTPAAATSAPTPAAAVASNTGSTPQPPVATPATVVSPTQDIIVPPPAIPDPGPAATYTPADRNDLYKTTPEMQIDAAKFYYATFKTNRGDIKVQLFADRAPNTVNNFIFLARQGFYDNTTFHRVLDGFMAQGGDPTGSGSGGPGYEFADEFYPGLVFDRPGLLAMANAGPNTNGSQFFITFAVTDWLNGQHTIFGQVIEGEDVLSRLTRRDPSTQPTFVGDTLYTVIIEESDTSVLPKPTPAPPTATPTMTPTPYAPTSLKGTRPLATVPAEKRVNYFNVPPEMVIDTAKSYTATISTSKGDLVVTLYDDDAPVAVNNFVVLADLGYYDDTPVSLVQPNDSIIIGAPDNNPLNDAGYKLPAEIGKVANTDIGAITYIPIQKASDGTILSSSSQLLIALVKPPDAINGQLAFFGQIVKGQEILSKLTTDDKIKTITITNE